ncbi:MAG: rhodanese-like domain-containing protein, partial [Gammaproteobacteria bacterium]
ILVDVRSRTEFDYVGHAPVAINVPWQDAPSWEVNPEFVQMVREKLQSSGRGRTPAEEQTVLAICRSGARSMAAGLALKQAGFRNVLNVAEGFEGSLDAEKHRGNINGWRFHKLPWEQT